MSIKQLIYYKLLINSFQAIMSAFIQMNDSQSSIDVEEDTINEIAHVDAMIALYGVENWMWYVKDTDNDCRIADMRRQWFYRKGVSIDFNIHDFKEEELEEEELEEEELEEEELEEEELENFYINMLKMAVEEHEENEDE